MRKAQDLSDSPPSQRPVSPPIPPKPAVALRKKTLAKKSAVAMIPPSPLAATQQQEALPQLMEKLKRSQQQMLDWQTEGNDFIPLSCCYDSSYQGSLVLEDEVNKFLADQTKKVMLLAGHSGAGKSLFTQGFISKLWDQYKEGDPIPLWVSLPNSKQPETHAIEETLLKCGFSHEQIQILKANCRFIFIFDAVDEIRSSKNLWVTNHLADWNARTIFTCRHEYLYWLENFKNLFTPIIEDRFEYASLSVMYVKPFSPDQIEHYVRQYIKRHDTLWKSWEEYQRGFEEVPGLKELTQTPYVLRIAVEALPDIMKRYEGIEPEKKKELTKAVLYDVFVERWFIRQERKLKDQGAISEQASMLFEFWDYAISLAQLMHEQQQCQVYYEPTEADIFDHSSNTSDENPFSRFFDPSNLRNQLLQSSCFIRQTGENLFAFAHKSLFDYFVSKGISDSSLKAAQQREQPKEYRTRKDSINLALLEESQVNFLAERVKENDEYKEYMLNWLYSSRGTPTNAIASANAITVLVKAGVTFNGADLSYLYLMGANISGGYFDRANFEGSDLENVIMHRVWMRQASLRRCNLKGVDFGEYPWIEHKDKVSCIIYREELNRLISLSNNRIYIWNLILKKCIHNIGGYLNSVNKSIAAGQDCQLIASGSYMNKVFLWSVDSNEPDVLEGHKFKVNSVCMSDNGKTLVSGSDDSIKVWDLSRRKLVKSRTYGRVLGCVSVNKDANIVAYGGDDLIVTVWNIQTEDIIALQGHEARVLSVGVNAKGTLAVSGSSDKTVRFWDLMSKTSIVFRGHDGQVNCVCFSPDEKMIISGGGDSKICIFDIVSGECTGLLGHKDMVMSIGISFDCHTLVSASLDKTVRFWNLESAKKNMTVYKKDNIFCLKLCGSVLFIVTSTNDQKLKIINVFDRVSKILPYSTTNFRDHYSVNMSRDGKYIIISEWSSVKIIDIDTEKITNLSGIYENIKRVYLTWSGNKLVADLFTNSDSRSKNVPVWDFLTGSFGGFSLAGKSISLVICSSDIDYAVYCENDKNVYLWNKMRNSSQLIISCEERVKALDISYNADFVISGGDDSKIRIYGVKTSEVKELSGHLGPVTIVRFSLNNSTAVSVGKDNTVRFWDTFSGFQNDIIYLTKSVEEISLNDNMTLLAVKFNDCVQLFGRQNDIGKTWELKWSSNFGYPSGALNLAEIDARDSRGLSWNNQQLFSQRKAILSKNPDSESSKNAESTLVTVSKQNCSPVHMGRHRADLDDDAHDNSHEKEDEKHSPTDRRDKCILC